ncbi:nucleolar protein dao-5 [Trifolium repens]|nr:nucleolar protein dao-5 [Trifolium repens]
MASANKELELEAELVEAGNKLFDPPSSVDHLLRLLSQVGRCLSKVNQSPTKSMQNALSPSLNALIADKLMKHSDVDVKVAVASCLIDLTRITAPDAPYNDRQMKEVLRLIVSSFENLHDKSSRWYAERILILEIFAKVRLCAVMLDLECDALIAEMFQHFFKSIREHHPENVFSSMKTIMVLVLEESEDISLDLLSPILDSLNKDNEVISPIARKLGESVLQSCPTKLKSYLRQVAMFSLAHYRAAAAA